MALTDQIIRLRFGMGVDTESDEKTLAVGRPTRLENAVFSRPSVVEKRVGHEALTRQTNLSLTVSSGALDVWSDGDTLYRHDGRSSLFSYGDSGWRYVGPMRSPTVRTQLSFPGPTERWNADMTYSGSVAVAAWEQAAGVYSAVIDSVDRTVLFGPTLLKAGGTRPRVLVCGTQFHIYMHDGAQVACSVFNPHDQLVSWRDNVPTPAQLTSDLDTSSPLTAYDVVSYGGATLLAYPSTANDVKLAYVTPIGTIANTTSAFSRPGPTTCSLGYVNAGPTLCVSPQGIIHVAAALSGSGVRRSCLYAASFTSASAPEVIDSTVTSANGDTVVRMTVESELTRVDGSSGGATSRAIFFYEVSSSAGSRVRVAGRDSLSAQVLAARHLAHRSRVAGRPYAIDSDVYCPLMNTEPTQQTVMLVDTDGVPFMKVLPGLASTPQSGTVPGWSRSSDGTDRIMLGSRLEVPTSLTGTTSYADRGMTELAVDWRATASLDWCTRDGYVFVGGGQVHMLDGASATEVGFHLYPEGVLTVPLSASGGGMNTAAGGVRASATSSFLYVPAYEWVDGLGRMHHSTGIPIAVRLTGSQNSVDLQVPTPQFTAKGTNYNLVSSNASIRVAVWRTTDGGTTYRRVDSPTAPVVCDRSGNLQNFHDRVSDAALSLNAVGTVYGLGSQLVQNFAPPAARHVAVIGERVWLGGIEGAPEELWCSKLGDTSLGPAFSALRTLSVPTAGGDVTGLAELDGAGVVFKRGRVYRFVGDGPEDRTDDATPFSVPATVNSTDGCTDSRSIVLVQGEAAQGIMFRSSNGYRLLDRGMAIHDIGAPVHEHVGLRVASVTHEPASNRIRITTQDGLALVFDSRFGQWATYTGVSGVGSCVWRDRLVFVRGDGTALVQATGSLYSDAGNTYPQLIELGWIPFEGLQDYGRVRHLHLLGTYRSPHVLRVDLAYGYQDGYRETHRMDTSRFLRGTGYGGGAYGGVTRTGVDVSPNPDGSTQSFVVTDSDAGLATVIVPPATYPTGALVTEVQSQLPPGFTFTMGVDGTRTSGSFFYDGGQLSIDWTGQELGLGTGSATRLRDSLGFSGDGVVGWPFEDGPYTGSPVAMSVATQPGPVYGGSPDSVYQMRIDLNRQKTSAVRIRIQDQVTGTVGGASFSLAELALTVAMLPGQTRLKRIRRG